MFVAFRLKKTNPPIFTKTSKIIFRGIRKAYRVVLTMLKNVHNAIFNLIQVNCLDTGESLRD
jgi:hypothetical protein